MRRRSAQSALAAVMLWSMAARAGAEPIEATLPFRTLALADHAMSLLWADQRDKIRATTRIVDRRGGPPLTATVHDGARTLQLSVHPDGTIDLIGDAGLYQRNPAVTFNRPKGSLGLEFGVSIVPPRQNPAPVTYYQSAVAQAQAALAAGAHDQGGVLGLFVRPKVQGLIFRFARCCGEVEIVGAGKTLHQDGSGAVHVRLDALDAPGAQMLAYRGDMTGIYPIVTP